MQDLERTCYASLLVIDTAGPLPILHSRRGPLPRKPAAPGATVVPSATLPAKRASVLQIYLFLHLHAYLQSGLINLYLPTLRGLSSLHRIHVPAATRVTFHISLNRGYGWHSGLCPNRPVRVPHRVRKDLAVRLRVLSVCSLLRICFWSLGNSWLSAYSRHPERSVAR